MEANFPEDLVLHILERLPVKSLLRFRCVSRHWYTLIASSGFIAAHVRQTNETNRYHVMLRNVNRELKKVSYKLCNDNENLDEIMMIDCPFVSKDYYFLRMVGCVNGLMCLSDDVVEDTDTLILWNPLIRRFLLIPKPELDVDSRDLSQSVYGFGFDSLSNDYKVISIMYHKNQQSGSCSIFKTSIAIFRLSACHWKISESSLVPVVDSRQAYMNGIIHWLASSKFILGFDVRHEVFNEIMLPSSWQYFLVAHLTIAIWCGSLSVFVRGHSSENITLWVMKDYGVSDSWVKQFVIQSYAVVRGLRSNGNIILHNIEGKLILYKPRLDQTEEFNGYGEGSVHDFHIKSYVESLVLLDKVDAQPVLTGTLEGSLFYQSAP